MTKHDDKIKLKHMLDHAKEAVALVRGKEKSDLRKNRLLELATTRLGEIVGEAAAKLSPENQAKYHYSMVANYWYAKSLNSCL